MRNLKLDLIQFQHLPVDSNNITSCIQINDAYFILSNNNVHFIKNNSEVIIKSNINTINWIPVENVLYMANGQAFECFNVETEQFNTITIPGGFIFHEWNPSQDRVALVDNDGLLTVVLLDAYNSHCTFIGEYKLDQIENNPFINIGWGSQNTQFRGSEGKYGTKKQNAEDSVAIGQDNSVRIAWRDSGDIFAVNFTRYDQRIFKVFSCECDFLYESEYKPGICAELAWKPDGTLLATECRIANGHRIMFFEKNGLFRYDLNLPIEKAVRKIQWNPAGDILMLWQESSDVSEISLWTCTNFKWYLKQNLIYNNSNNKINYVGWNEKKRLEVITSKYIIHYSWKWDTCISTERCTRDLELISNELGAVCVIDGATLRVSITSTQIIPPPYSSYDVIFDKPINNVSFGAAHNSLAIVLSDNTVKILEISKSDYKEIFSSKIESESIPLALNNFVYDDEQSALYCVESFVNNQSGINKYNLDYTNNKLIMFKYFESSENITDLLRIHDPSKLGFYLGACTATQIMICCPDFTSNSLVLESDLILAEDDVDNGGHNSVEYIIDKFHTFSLHNQRFYYNGKKIANNITSYLLCHGYLLLTTTDSKLLCVKLSENSFKNLEINNFSKVYTRSIPTGALLIIAVPGTRKIILQVPRGELEIINPRVLAIEEIDRLLSKKKHLEAYMIMRTDRINPNLLYDINPTRFLNDIQNFIKNINNCEYIDVFLTQLQDSNITEELYSKCFEEVSDQSEESKLSIVAETFIETMKKLDNDYYLQSIITAYLCKGSDEDLEKALEEIAAAKQREDNGVKLRVPVDSTLEHMIILTSVEKLYDIALGMDKLELIMWVASKSQLDPLEYIPFLRELITMEENYRNYKINCHIKRFEKAFTFLIKCNDVLNELTEFITKNSLHRVILTYLRPNNQWYKPLLEFYGKYLSKEGRYKESGLIFMRIESYKLALDNFVKGCCMKEALTAFVKLGSNVIQFHDSLIELASKLNDKKQFLDASYIYDSLLNNYEESIFILLTGNLWSDAFYLAIKNNRNDIIETDIKPSISNFVQDLCTSFKTYEDEFSNLKNRLQIIRNERIQQLNQNGNQCFENEHIDCAGRNIDLESVVSTTYSRTTSQRSKSSHMTSASSRRKKRIERKVLQIREGSAFENIAIIRRLYCIIVEVQNLGKVVSDTCSQLFLFSEFNNKATELQTLYKKLIDNIMSSKEIIWPQDMLIPPNPITVECQVYRQYIEHLGNKA